MRSSSVWHPFRKAGLTGPSKAGRWAVRGAARGHHFWSLPKSLALPGRAEEGKAIDTG